jgi:hypothetical protein
MVSGMTLVPVGYRRSYGKTTNQATLGRIYGGYSLIVEGVWVKDGRSFVFCKCPHKDFVIVGWDNLRQGKVHGCLKCMGESNRTTSAPLNVGHKFGDWEVVDNTYILKDNIKFLKCRCPHIEKEVRYNNLISKQSIGCRQCFIDRNKKHTDHTRKEWIRWKNMIRRCTDPNATGYSSYGGRGIEVESYFLTFSNWLEFISSLDNAFDSGRSIDRINNNGNYCRGNIQWSTQLEQVCNTRRSRTVECYGVTYVFEFFCREVSRYARTTTRKLLEKGIPPEQLKEGTVPGIRPTKCK